MSILAASPRWSAPAGASGGGGQGPAAGAAGAGGWLRLAGEAWRLPFRIFGLGLELLGRTGQESRRAFGGGVADAVSQGYDPSATAAQPLWATAVPLAPPPNPGLNPNVLQGTPAAAPASGAAGGGPAGNIAGNPDRKEKPMATCCDDGGPSELKIIDYSILNVDPYLGDCDEEEEGVSPRVLYSGTVTTTQDMSDEAFTAMVIAMYFQQPPEKRRKIPHCDKQYLRVCQYVQCRVPIPRANYQRKQVEVLEQISRRLGASVVEQRPASSSRLPAKA
jgi:hypothetical protein